MHCRERGGMGPRPDGARRQPGGVAGKGRCPMMNISELTVTGLDGRPVRLASLFAERRVVLAFLRHFG